MAKSDSSVMNEAVLAAIGIIFIIVVFVASLVVLSKKPKSTPVTHNSGLRTAGLDENERRRLERRVLQQREREERQRRYESAVAAAELNPYQEKLRRREEERLERELAERQEIQRRQREETAEFDKWKRDLSVVDSGASESGPVKSVNELVSYVKEKKIVELSAIASAFGIQPDDAVARLSDLEKQGKLYGVIDEKARYVFIEEDEMRKIVDFFDSMNARIPLDKLSETVAGIIQVPGS